MRSAILLSIAVATCSVASTAQQLPQNVVADPIEFIQGEWVHRAKPSDARIRVEGRKIILVEADDELRTAELLDGDLYFEIESWKPEGSGVRFSGVCWSRGKKSDGSPTAPSPYRMCGNWSLYQGGPEGARHVGLSGFLRPADKAAGRGVTTY